MKRIFLALAVVFIAAGVNAQAPSFGVKAGLNLSNTTNGDGNKIKPGLYAGVTAEWKFTDFVGFAPELVYSRQGTTAKGINDSDFGGSIDRVSIRLNYLNLPLMVRLYVDDKFTVSIGPQIGFLLNSKFWVKNDGSTMSESIDGSNSVDFSFGVGVDYDLLPNLAATARFNVGLTNWNEYFDSKNRVFQLGLAYRF